MSHADIMSPLNEQERTKMQFERPAFISTARTMACAALLAGLFAAPVRCEEVKAGDLVITQAWSRATPGCARVAGGFLTIENKGSAADRLVGGPAGVARKKHG